MFAFCKLDIAKIIYNFELSKKKPKNAMWKLQFNLLEMKELLICFSNFCQTCLQCRYSAYITISCSAAP